MNEFFAGLLAAILSILPGGAAEEAGYAGYLEADYVYVAPLSAGQIAGIAVAEGQAVVVGDVLFTLDDRQQRALLAAAAAQVVAAQANLDNLRTGSRPPEIEVIRASLDKAQSDLTLAETTLARSETLLAARSVAAAQVDSDRAAVTAAQAQVAQWKAQVAVAELPARDAEQAAAEANLKAAQADADRTRLDLEDRQPTAPVSGVVDRLFYSVGEMAAAGTPVLSIIPEGALKAR